MQPFIQYIHTSLTPSHTVMNTQYIAAAYICEESIPILIPLPSKPVFKHANYFLTLLLCSLHINSIMWIFLEGRFNLQGLTNNTFTLDSQSTW